MSLYNKIKRLVGKAIFGYQMLSAEDFIIVAMSGGEDSLALAYFLSEWRKKLRVNYRLIGVHLDMGFPCDQEVYEKGVERLRNFCQSLNMEFYVEKTDCGKQALEVAEKKTTAPCFVCSWHRRKHLFKLAEAWQANKIAFGHHKDDLLVTFFINLFYHGELSTILPVQEMFKGNLYLIRPLVFVEKDMISRFVKSQGWEVLKNPCPFSEQTKRKFIENWLKENVYLLDPRIKKSIFNAMFNPKFEYLPKKPASTYKNNLFNKNNPEE
ncbi:tRNA 2-thiocytidine biosynthesis protein TtcA [Thermodesulfobacterium sp. TA1]|uniref:tRNA lysidine(34) synthetase n=1 Tax=Thermodesulfobacterium sp. TA1 TaxID=2234087 RepID=UPI0012322EE4|nr:tRNA 2-thiocytidine biosynthesis TtcA family protein [Thermodesulfobacterium sp. TA1]QER42207.1 tRNA 2-thiocytidine biosynthesis protein TtcA [Thermodesulfobacterium sp. TA1]